MNFKEENIVYTSKFREAIYHSVLKCPDKHFKLYSNQWRNMYRTICLNSCNGKNFNPESEKIFKNSGVTHNFFPFYGKEGILFGVGGIDNWKYDEEFYRIKDYKSFVRIYEEKFRKSSKDQNFNITEHRRLLSDKTPLNHVRGIYLFNSNNGKDWKQLYRLPIVNTFNEGFINAINLFGKSSEFDGHINVIYNKNNDEYILYLRANVSKGSRFIQYAKSKDLMNWSKFSLIKLDVYNKKDNYYTPCIMKYKEKLFGMIPYFNQDNFCSIRIISSDDGINWKFIEDIYKSKTVFYRGEKPKNNNHMVNGFIENEKELYFYIHKNYSGLTKNEPVVIQRLSISKKEFERYI